MSFTLNFPTANMKHFVKDNSEVRLRDFFQEIYNNFEFYRLRFSQAGVEPGSDPLLTLDRLGIFLPEEYMNFQTEVSQRLWGRHFLTDHTTGSTGEKKYRVATALDDEAEAKLSLRFFVNCGMTSKDRVLALDIDSADIYLFYGKVFKELNIQSFSFCSVPADFGNSLTRLFFANPTAIITVPSLLSRIIPIIKHFISTGHLSSLRRIIYIGEEMPKPVREILETACGLEVFSFFGSTETGSVAGECKQHNGIHIYNDDVIPSLIDPIQVNNTFSGEIVWTTLHFFDQPLVKYATRDYVSIIDEQCDCGIHGPRILSVKRLQDQFTLFGQKFYYDAFANAIIKAGICFEFFQIEVSEKYNQVHLTFWLPSKLRIIENTLNDMFLNVDDFEYFVNLSYLSYELKFVEHPVYQERKLKRVINRLL